MYDLLDRFHGGADLQCDDVDTFLRVFLAFGYGPNMRATDCTIETEASTGFWAVKHIDLVTSLCLSSYAVVEKRVDIAISITPLSTCSRSTNLIPKQSTRPNTRITSSSPDFLPLAATTPS